MNRFFFYAGLFHVTAATLMLQLIQTRILSVVAWYHLAFFVISAAMFGLTAGAVWIHLHRTRYTQETLSSDLAHYSTLFAVTTALALVFQTTLVPVVKAAVTPIFIWIELSVLLAVPFFFSGIVVSLALTRSPFPVGRVYGVDLIGAAVGCFGVLALLNNFNGPSAVLWTAVVAGLGAVFFSQSGIGHEAKPGPRLGNLFRRRGTWLLVLVAAATLNSMDEKRFGLYPIYAKDKIQLLALPWIERWNSFSRIVVGTPTEGSPDMWGPSRNFIPDQWSITQSRLNIDGDAGTTAYGLAGDLSQAQFLRFDVTNLAYHLDDRKSAAIVGVGGGRDILSARVFGVPHIIGVEINPVFVDLLRREPNFSKFVGLNELDGVSLVVDEARSWFARSDDMFDVIQMSLIDTWAATGAGAFTLSENGLYTLEAWQIFLRRLNPGGVFTVSRWYSPQYVAETGRLVSLAVATLIRAGVKRPKDHIFLVASGRIATLVLSGSGFTSGQVRKLRSASEDLGFEQLIVPGEEPTSNLLAKIVRSTELSQLDNLMPGLPLDLTPPTDDRPFFFNQLPLKDAIKVVGFALSGRSLGVVQGNFLATATLVMLFCIALVLVVAAIVIPLRSTLKDIGPRIVIGGTAYFMLIGTGFMLVEIGFLQRFSVFLGHPIYSLSIVLFSLILSTGIGSLLSDLVKMEERTRFALWSVATGGYILSQMFWVPALLLAFDGGPLILRGLVCIGVILPAGILLGFGFPAGMRLVSAVDSRPTAWFWGINGASSVLASAIAVGCSIAYGIGTTLALGAACYFLLIPAAFILSFRTEPSERAASSQSPCTQAK